MNAEAVGHVVGNIIGVAIVAGLFWVLPIALGIRAARRKHRSPQWMWFGVHPVGGWIACLVLASLAARKPCPSCAEHASPRANLCPYCGHRFTQMIDRPDVALAHPNGGGVSALSN